MADRYGVNYIKTTDGNRDMIDVSVNGGRVRCSIDTYELVGATVDINDRILLAKVPSGAVILPQSTFVVDAITGLNDVDVGDANDPNGLADALDFSSAGSVAFDAIDAADWGKKLWELLGYTSDPGGMLDIAATCIAEPTGDGTITLVLFYSVD